MTRRKKHKSRALREVAGPQRVVDGIPDRSQNCAKWKYLLLGAVFVAWVVFLVYCWLAGGADQ